MKVNEIFYSLQGEGKLKGLPTVFVRLQGCNIGCDYCDTKYALSSREGKDCSVTDILKRVWELTDKRLSWICITGGEPLLQSKELELLVRILYYGDYRLTIETNGTLPFPFWGSLVESWNVDYKGPSSGFEARFDSSWLSHLSVKDQLKFVVKDPVDLNFLVEAVKEHNIESSLIYVSPIMDIVRTNGVVTISNPDFLEEVWNLCVREGYRFTLQDHKIVFGSKIGV